LRSLPTNAAIFDIGCGNNSPFYTKSILPNCHYTGIDVGDYNQTEPILADQYILSSSSDFVGSIEKFQNTFDAVISNHNLEHCDDRQGVINAMLKAIKPQGRLFMAFPCEQSVNFPKRAGSLNYFDDSTHQGLPPNFDALVAQLENAGFRVDFAARNYRPLFHYLIGFFNEKASRRQATTLAGTWAYYGFESILWATNLSDSPSK
jgi:SAM-dependent methyltransferase